MFKQLLLDPCDTDQSLFEYGFEFAKIFDKVGCTAVSMTPHVREAMARFKGNIYKKKHGKIILHHVSNFHTENMGIN
jgi:hypothetical protein